MSINLPVAFDDRLARFRRLATLAIPMLAVRQRQMPNDFVRRKPSGCCP